VAAAGRKAKDCLLLVAAHTKDISQPHAFQTSAQHPFHRLPDAKIDRQGERREKLRHAQGIPTRTVVVHTYS
jgi:hypothetical protein